VVPSRSLREREGLCANIPKSAPASRRFEAISNLEPFAKRFLESNVTHVLMRNMKLNLLSQATWFCMKCEELPYGMDMVVMDPTNPSVRVVWDLFSDRVLSESVIANNTVEINERHLRCPECGSADVVIPNRVEEEPRE
jgi:hypothetical protein